MVTDRDLTDQGVRLDESPMSRAEHQAARRELLARMGSAALTGTTVDETKPQASARARARAMNEARRRMGWGPSRSTRLAQPCPTCGVDALTWCRKGGYRWAKPTHGRICEGRGRSD